MDIHLTIPAPRNKLECDLARVALESQITALAALRPHLPEPVALTPTPGVDQMEMDLVPGRILKPAPEGWAEANEEAENRERAERAEQPQEKPKRKRKAKVAAPSEEPAQGAPAKPDAPSLGVPTPGELRMAMGKVLQAKGADRVKEMLQAYGVASVPQVRDEDRGSLMADAQAELDSDG